MRKSYASQSIQCMVHGVTTSHSSNWGSRRALDHIILPQPRKIDLWEQGLGRLDKHQIVWTTSHEVGGRIKRQETCKCNHHQWLCGTFTQVKPPLLLNVIFDCAQ